MVIERIKQWTKTQILRFLEWKKRGGTVLTAAYILTVSVCVMMGIMGLYQSVFFCEEEVAAALTWSEERPALSESDPAAEQLARFLALEAGDKPYLVKLGIGAVVRNRVQHPLYPNTVAEVLDGLMLEKSLSVSSASPDDSATIAATAALYGSDPTGGALYYEKKAKNVPEDAQILGKFYGVVFFKRIK